MNSCSSLFIYFYFNLWRRFIILYSLLFFVKKPHPLTAPIVLVLGWTLLITLPIVGPTAIQTSERGSFYGLSGAWCWIGTGYSAERLIYLYVSIFFYHNVASRLTVTNQFFLFLGLGLHGSRIFVCRIQ